MIYFIDNFLSQDLLNDFLNDKSPFIEHKTVGKSFWVRIPDSKFNNYVIQKIQKIENKRVKNILSFFREAKQGQDNNWRIHNDTIIMGQQPDRAIVLFMESEDTNQLNGTGFWEHKEYGDTYNGNGTEQFNKILARESENINKWTLKSLVGYKQNRLLSYPCNYFHSKYPNEFKQPRRVFVMFYQTL